MATFARQAASEAGAAVVYGVVHATDDWVNTGGEKLHVKNGNVAACVVTVTAVGKCSHGFLHNRVVTIPAGEDRFIGPFDHDRFTDPATGKAGVAFSVQSSVTAALL